MKAFGQIVAGITYVDRPGAYGLLHNAKAELAVVRTGQGYFLPGGGLDPGEDDLTGLDRELREEIGYTLTHAVLLGQAAQYHWSAFYNSYFKKIGTFYRIEANPVAGLTAHPDHELLWLRPRDAGERLTQEFQRWAVNEYA